MSSISLTKTQSKSSALMVTKPIFWILFFLALAALIYFFFPIRNHWYEIFRPAALALVRLENPYDVQYFFNPPWTLLPIIPFALLPEKIGFALFGSATLFSFGYVARRMGASWPVTIAFLLLPHTLYNAIQVNVEWLVALGFLLPPQIGLFFVLIKPQYGVFIALFWLIESWHKGGFHEVARVFLPISSAFLISLIFFGSWFMKGEMLVLADGKNFWPWSVPIGLVLLFISLKNRKLGPTILSGPFLTPYTQPYSWPVALLGLLPNKKLMIFGIILLWIFQNGTVRFMLETVISIFLK